VRISTILIAIAVAAAATAASATAAHCLERPVDLNPPGALEQLKVERPTQYAAVTDVLRTVEHVPCEKREVRELSVRLNIQELACKFSLMTSNPPKRRLSFALESTSYVAVVTMKEANVQFLPAKRTE